jgi:hypothetical protein
VLILFLSSNQETLIMAITTESAPTTKTRRASAPTETATPKRTVKARKQTVSVAMTPGTLVPVMMDVEIAKFLLRSLTAALSPTMAGKKKKK